MFKRIALIQVLSSGAFLASFTYIAILGDELGLTRTQIALAASLYSVAQFVSSYVFGRIADRFGRRKLLLLGLLVLSFLVFLQGLSSDLFSVIGFRTLAGVGFGMFPAALAAYAFQGNTKMGKFASFGALGWGLSLIAAGPVADTVGVRAVFYMASALVFLSFLTALTLPALKEVRITTPLLPIRMILKNREILLPYIIRHSTASSIWVLWPIFLTSELGLSFFQVGLVQATNAFTQFSAMFVMGDRLSPRKAVGLGFLLTSIAALSFILIRSFPLFLITQIVLGLSWANLYVGSLRSMMAKNRERATAVGLLNSSISLSSLMGPLLALGLIAVLPDISFEGPMYLAAAASMVSFFYYRYWGMDRVPVRDSPD